MHTWPPAYTVKRHWRARHVKMSYSQDGLEITIPMRFSMKHLPALLDEHKDWIIKQSASVQPRAIISKPDIMQFLAFNKQWSVHYFQSEKRTRIKAIVPDGLIVTGDIQNETHCLQKLTAWVRVQASALLSAYFQRLSIELNLPYLDVCVRSQSTMWGSCSPDKSIRLNYKLVFLPEALMRHIMIHELCHTKHMNHSEQFWQLVARYDDQWLQHKKAIKKADHYMPAWLK